MPNIIRVPGGGQSKFPSDLAPLCPNFVVERNGGKVKISADKIQLNSLTNMVSGGVWAWGKTRPTKPTGENTKQWSRAELITTGKPYDGLYLGDVTASDAVNEILLWLPENDSGKVKLVPFIILSTDYLGGVYVMRKHTSKDFYGLVRNQNGSYFGGGADVWITNTYLNSVLGKNVSSALLDCEITTAGVKQTRKCWIPGMPEVGSNNYPGDGEKMPYFASDQRRIAYDEDTGTPHVSGYWTRTQASSTHNFSISSTGKSTQTIVTNFTCYRPSFVLPKDFKIQQRPDGSYTVWNENGLIKLGDIEASSENTEVVVHISEKTNNVPIPYLYLSSKYSGSGNMLLRKEAFKNSVTSGTYAYTSSNMNTTIQNWSSGFSSKLKELLTPVDISFRIGSSGIKVQSAKMSAFLLSSIEFGNSVSWYPAEKIPYFNTNERRKCKIEGTNTYVSWYSRDVSIYNSSKYWWYGCVKEDGSPKHDVRQDESAYIRPAITIVASSPIRQLADGSYDLVPDDPALSQKQTRAPEVSVEPSKGTPIQLKDVAVSTSAKDVIIKIPEKDHTEDYIYIANGHDGNIVSLLMRKRVSANGNYNASTTFVNYTGSTMDNYFVDFAKNILDSSVQTHLVECSIPVNSGRIKRTCFCLERNELGLGDGIGTAIAYFGSDRNRKFETDAGVTTYWTRNTDGTGTGSKGWFVNSDGKSQYTYASNSTNGYRVVISVSPEAYVTDNGDGTYTFVGDEPAPTEQPLEIEIDWPESDPLIARQWVYNTKGQYQTMLLGGVASTEDAPAYSPVLAENTWEQIAQACADDDLILDKWQVGDTKDESINGETLTFAIMGKNMDDLADGSGKAHLTFGMTQLMAAQRSMNGSNTNAGSFAGSSMYSWLSGSVYSGLNSELKKAIKAVNKKTSAGNNSSSIRTDAMYLWLFSEVEVFGTITYSYAGEGLHYPYFATASERIKKLSNGTGAVSYWWERSPFQDGSRGFYGVDTSGSAGLLGASGSGGVCFGFCI